MAYKKKAEQEKEFVDYILSVGGVVYHREMAEGNKTYHEFKLANDTTRYWTDMTEESLKRLGIGTESEDN